MPFVTGDAVSSGPASRIKNSAIPNFDEAALSTSTNPSLHVVLAGYRMPRGAMIIL
jgi:hypothetical protein